MKNIGCGAVVEWMWSETEAALAEHERKDIVTP